MYSIRIAGWDAPYTLAQAQRDLAAIVNREIDRDPATYAAAHALCGSLEELACRGMRYSNQDFDLLSAAHRLVGSYWQSQRDALKAECAGRAPTDAEWERLFLIEGKLQAFGLLEFATYNED